MPGSFCIQDSDHLMGARGWSSWHSVFHMITNFPSFSSVAALCLCESLWLRVLCFSLYISLGLMYFVAHSPSWEDQNPAPHLSCYPCCLWLHLWTLWGWVVISDGKYFTFIVVTLLESAARPIPQLIPYPSFWGIWPAPLPQGPSLSGNEIISREQTKLRLPSATMLSCQDYSEVAACRFRLGWEQPLKQVHQSHQWKVTYLRHLPAPRVRPRIWRPIDNKIFDKH